METMNGFAKKPGALYWSKASNRWQRRKTPLVENVASCRACGVEFRRVGIAKKRCDECAAKSRLRIAKCVHCKKQFPARSKKDRFCSASCAQSARWKPNRTCKNCGDRFRKARNCPGHFCSWRCRDEAKAGCEPGWHIGIAYGRWLSGVASSTCRGCGRQLDSKKRKLCSECKSRREETHKESNRLASRHAHWGWVVCGCGELFLRDRGCLVLRCFACRKAAYRAAQLLAKANRGRRERQRFSESIDPKAVFERDGWMCHICGVKAEMFSKVPEPLAPTIDHVVPLSKGGRHTMGNLACAHFRCNSAKRDRYEPMATGGMAIT